MTTGAMQTDSRTATELAVPAHLARYALEVEAWRLEALAYRASQSDAWGRDR